MKTEEKTIRRRTSFGKTDNYKRLEPEDPVSGQEFFDKVLDRFGIDLKDPSNLLIVHWKEIVDPFISEHAKPQRIKDGVLYLACDHPSRASYIRLNAREILKSIKGVFPEIELNKIITRVK